MIPATPRAMLPSLTLRLPLLVALAGAVASGPVSEPGAATAALEPVAGRVEPTPIRYRVSFEGRDHREARVEVVLADVGPGPVVLRMSRTSPGRYALHEFAKNVYDVSIEGVRGTSAEVQRPDPHQWTVTGHGGEVRLAYTLYADRADGTYSQVDRTHAHLNVPATFMFAPDLMERPVELTVVVPEGSGWEVATQLGPTGDPFVFTAPDGHYFMDSPLEIADLEWREWEVSTEHGPKTIRIAMHHLGTDAELDRYAESTRRIVDELAAVFGAWPDFEFDRYTFLSCYVPWASGDGMEHRNSTVLSSSGSLASNMTGLLGTVAHEFEHAWNIERIRPASLEPFDFTEANMSRELWFGEGFTSYLDDVTLVRAGVIDEQEFVRRMGGIANQVVEAPGRRYFSPVEMSMQAPFVDAATSVDPTNRVNTFLSYYTWGSGVGLALDLALRGGESGRTLDDLMAAMWNRHGEPERPYTVEDVEAVLADVSGDPAFAREFFARYVSGRDAPDYPALFRSLGVAYGEGDGGAARLTGAALREQDGAVVVMSNTVAGDPLHRAGVDRGDRLVEIEGRPFDAAALEALRRDGRPGDTVALEVEGRGARRSVRVTLDRQAERVERPDPAASPAARARREAWIASGRTP